MRKMLAAIAVATSATLPAVAAFDADCVLYYDFETMADEYQVENVANPGVMQLNGKTNGLATVVETRLFAVDEDLRTVVEPRAAVNGSGRAGVGGDVVVAHDDLDDEAPGVMEAAEAVGEIAIAARGGADVVADAVRDGDEGPTAVGRRLRRPAEERGG